MIPVIFGCEGLRLTAGEKAFFADSSPLGFILFARNIDSPDQVRALTDEMRDLLGREHVPVLIDQEGGRVQRMAPPHWRRYPAPKVFGDLADMDPTRAASALRLNSRLIADDLRRVGITVNCAPVLDVLSSKTTEAIGDRAFSDNPDLVGALGRIVIDGLQEGGVLPVVKHMPGHGRARVDSHKTLPVVDAPLRELSDVDFRPFQLLSDAPLAMTAHMVFSAVDASVPCTLSRVVISRIIRMMIGFQGLLFSDDLSMEALSGTLGERAEQALSAGCDIALHCNGDMGEMQSVAENVPVAALDLADRLSELISRLPTISSDDRAEMEARYNDIMNDYE